MKRQIIFIFSLILLALNGEANNYNLPDILKLGLPVVVVETENGEEPSCEFVKAPEGSLGSSITNETKVPGSVLVYSPEGEILYNSGDYVKGESGMTIKLRGNGTAYSKQKPYKIKLQKKADLLARGDKKFNDKNWVLILDYDLKYSFGFEVSKILEEEWTPQGMHVNVIMNGDYRGLYYLIEGVEQNEKCRINVSDDGFILEHDAYWWNENGAYISSQLHPFLNFTFKYPDYEDLDEERLELITQIMADYEEAMEKGEYEGIIDLPSFAKWILGHDILGTTDGAGANLFLSKYDLNQSSQIKAGPLWDFDAILLTPGNWSNVHSWSKRFESFFKSGDTPFMQHYLALWDENKEEIFESLYNYTSEMRNGEEWEAYNRSLQESIDSGNPPTINSQKAADSFDDWLGSRKEWLETNINELRNKTSDDDKNSGLKPLEKDYLGITISGNKIIPLISGENIHIYSISGSLINTFITEENQPITLPASGIYIIKIRDKAYKIIVK